MSEPTYYTPGEKARLAALAARGSYRVTRGKSTARVDRRIDAIKAEALLREEMEEEARRIAEDRRLRERIARRTRGLR